MGSEFACPTLVASPFEAIPEVNKIDYSGKKPKKLANIGEKGLAPGWSYWY
jgi:hypothetical protein